MTLNWQQNGFKAPPILTTATGAQRLYRAWGGPPDRKWGNTELPGVCFSLDRATSRRQAQMLYSVMEYQNPVYFLTEFSVPRGTPLWFGEVDPGDRRALLGPISGNQVFIERSYMVLVKEVSTTALSDDLGANVVYTGKSPRVSS